MRGARLERPQRTPCPHYLFNDVMALEVAQQPQSAGRTKSTPHRTARLGRYTDRGTVGVEHQDALDLFTGGQLKKRFVGHLIISTDGAYIGQRANGVVLREFAPQGQRQIGHLLDVVDQIDIQLAIDLFGAEGRLRIHGKQVDQLGQGVGEQIAAWCRHNRVSPQTACLA